MYEVNCPDARQNEISHELTPYGVFAQRESCAFSSRTNKNYNRCKQVILIAVFFDWASMRGLEWSRFNLPFTVSDLFSNFKGKSHPFVAM